MPELDNQSRSERDICTKFAPRGLAAGRTTAIHLLGAAIDQTLAN